MLCDALCVVLVKPLKQTNNDFSYVCMLKQKDRFDDVDKKILAFIYTLFRKEFLQTTLFCSTASDKDNWIDDNRHT